MSLLGNIVWLVFGGLVSAFSWMGIGLLWCLSIIGIPIGLQCFKLAGLTLWPFGKQVVYSGHSMPIIINVLWFLFGGLPLALGHLMNGLILYLTIIGIPFGKQHFKLAAMALAPFGTRIVTSPA